MRRILAVFTMVWCIAAQPDAKVTYRASQATVQDIVKKLAGQAGLGYDRRKSSDQTHPECQRELRDVRIEEVPFPAAMQQILGPLGLRYQVESEKIVLYRAVQQDAAPQGLPLGLPPGDTGRFAPPPPDDKLVNYTAHGRKSVQYVVVDLAKQVGLGYNWDQSFAQTDPECRNWVFGLRIKNQPFAKAMAKVLGPVGLRYQVENGQVVLYRR